MNVMGKVGDAVSHTCLAWHITPPFFPMKSDTQGSIPAVGAHAWSWFGVAGGSGSIQLLSRSISYFVVLDLVWRSAKDDLHRWYVNRAKPSGGV